jgi:hypothetical protein
MLLLLSSAPMSNSPFPTYCMRSVSAPARFSSSLLGALLSGAHRAQLFLPARASAPWPSSSSAVSSPYSQRADWASTRKLVGILRQTQYMRILYPRATRSHIQILPRKSEKNSSGLWLSGNNFFPQWTQEILPSSLKIGVYLFSFQA